MLVSKPVRIDFSEPVRIHQKRKAVVPYTQSGVPPFIFSLGSPILGSRTPPFGGMLVLGLLAAGEVHRRQCRSRDRALDVELDDWCQINCNADDPNCPHAMCECDARLACLTVHQNVTNSWCMNNCNSDTMNCPPNMCKCEGFDFSRHADERQLRQWWPAEHPLQWQQPQQPAPAAQSAPALPTQRWRAEAPVHWQYPPQPVDDVLPLTPLQPLEPLQPPKHPSIRVSRITAQFAPSPPE